MNVRWPFAAAALVLALGAGLAACGNGGGASGGFTPIPSPTPVPTAPSFYIALGDDATVGIGTSACGTALPSTICPSDPVKVTGSARTVGGGVAVNGYAQLFDTQLSTLHPALPLTFVPLGVSGALVGDEPKPAATPNDLLTNADQLATLPGVVSSARAANDRIVVSVFAGINDVIDAFRTSICANPPPGTGTLPAFCATVQGTTVADGSGNVKNGSLYKGYLALFSAIKAAAPDALVVYGVPDVSLFPAFASYASTPALQLQLASYSQLATTALQAAESDAKLAGAFVALTGTSGAGPTLATPAGFAADGLHFSDAGQTAIEVAGFAQFTATYPAF